MTKILALSVTKYYLTGFVCVCVCVCVYVCVCVFVFNLFFFFTLFSRFFFLVIFFIHSIKYTCQSKSPSLSHSFLPLLVCKCLFSMSVSLFLFCKESQALHINLCKIIIGETPDSMVYLVLCLDS